MTEQICSKLGYKTDGVLTLVAAKIAAPATFWLVVKDNARPTLQKLVLINSEDEKSAWDQYQADNTGYHWAELNAVRGVAFLHNSTNAHDAMVFQSEYDDDLGIMATYRAVLPHSESSFPRISCTPR